MDDAGFPGGRLSQAGAEVAAEAVRELGQQGQADRPLGAGEKRQQRFGFVRFPVDAGQRFENGQLVRPGRLLAWGCEVTAAGEEVRQCADRGGCVCQSVEGQPGLGRR